LYHIRMFYVKLGECNTARKVLQLRLT
jgi:hypothetical protein